MLQFFRNTAKLRLRHLAAPVRFVSAQNGSPTEHLVTLRLADKTHRHLFRTLETEARKFKKSPVVQLRPTIRHFLVWLQRKQNSQLRTRLVGPALPSPFRKDPVLEIAVFHILISLHSDVDGGLWQSQQVENLEALHQRLAKDKKFGKHTMEMKNMVSKSVGLAEALGRASSMCSPQIQVISKALECFCIANKTESIDVLVSWIQSLEAPSVTAACQELANLTEIPAFVTSDILLRTPMSKDELDLQLDLWEMFMVPIGKAYHTKTSHTSIIVENLAYYCVQYNPSRLSGFVSSTLDFFTSTKSGFAFKLIDLSFVNGLIWKLAYYYVQSSSQSRANAMGIIRAHENLVKFATHSNLSQEGYMGVVMAISQVSEEKSHKLFEISKTRFHEHTTYFHAANIYLSKTPEQLLHNFNSSLAQHPLSAMMWLFFVKKLQTFELLNENRAQKLLKELVSRKEDLIISKDIILTLLQPIDSVNAIEVFAETLSSAGIIKNYANIVHNKYMALLFKFGREKNVHKPYLDQIIRNTSNIACARHLYSNLPRKTTSNVGTMLNGEVLHQPEKVYDFYLDELHGRIPDESSLLALLRAAVKPQNRGLMWGQLYAFQVSVHEFKKHVAESEKSTEGILPSNKLWKMYIRVLSAADYLAELAEIIRWWEQVHFEPPRSTLMLLLQSLPDEFAERHIKHAFSVPKNSSFVLSWQWPTLDEYQSQRRG